MSEGKEEKEAPKKVEWKPDEKITMTIKKGDEWKPDKKLTMILEESLKGKKKDTEK